MSHHDREWAFDPPPGITDRETGLVSVIKKLRYELTACQGLVTEALKMIAAIPQLETAGQRTTCPKCEASFPGARTLAEHDYTSHNGPLPDHWAAIETKSLEPADPTQEATE
jgi:hypothetical protein